MDRRSFLKQVALWSAGLTLTPPLFRLTPEVRAEGRSPLVAVTEGTDYGALVSKVLGPLGGLQNFVKKGQKVVIKPNIGWDRTPEQGANTHPEVIKALARLALDVGASQVLVFDRPCNEERRCYTNSGIKKAVESLGDRRVTCPYLDNRKFVPVRVAKGKSIHEWDFYKEALEADCYINVPVAKHHSSAGLSLGLKNIMGVLGGNRSKIHFTMGQALADLNTVLKPALTITDATRLLLRNGPQGGDVKDVKVLNTLIASTDIVAIDAYATTLFNMKPQEIESTQAAYHMGLGEMDLKKIKIAKI
jgi:uncharacterized protein (DUF362 family)